jgi:hypothetical protein
MGKQLGVWLTAWCIGRRAFTCPPPPPRHFFQTAVCFTQRGKTNQTAIDAVSIFYLFNLKIQNKKFLTKKLIDVSMRNISLFDHRI